jgi:hypothetical protein
LELRRLRPLHKANEVRIRGFIHFEDVPIRPTMGRYTPLSLLVVYHDVSGDLVKTTRAKAPDKMLSQVNLDTFGIVHQATISAFVASGSHHTSRE